MDISHNPSSGEATEDVAHASGDTGLQVLAVRNDTSAAMTSADGDYSPITVDSTGRLRVDATITEAATATDGGALPGIVKVIGGYDGANVQAIATDVNGELQVDVVGALPAGTNNIGDVDVLTEPATSADGALGLPAVVKVIGGYDGTNVQAIATDAAGELQIDVVGSLPAGTNNIGDVDVLALPGAFAEDSGHSSGDIGHQILAVRNDANAVLTSTDLDYSPIAVDSAGRLKVTASVTEEATAADGGALPALTKVVSGYDGANVQVLHTDASGDLQVDLASSIPAGTNNIGDVDVLTEPATAADGALGLPAVVKIIGGYDGANVQAILTDASGNVGTYLSASLPAGTNNIGDVDVLTEPATAADGAAGLPAVTKVVSGYDGANVQALHTDASGDLQVDLASSLPAGTNNIGDVDVLTLPATFAEDSGHTTGDLGMQMLAVRNDAGTTLAGTNLDYAPLSLDSSGNLRAAISGGVSVSKLDIVDFFDTPLFDASSVNIPGSASSPVEVVASTAATVEALKINDTTGFFIGLYTGAVAAEVLKMIIGPGEDQTIECAIPSGTRISLRAMETTAISTGLLTVQFLG